MQVLLDIMFSGYATIVRISKAFSCGKPHLSNPDPHFTDNSQRTTMRTLKDISLFIYQLWQVKCSFGLLCCWTWFGNWTLDLLVYIAQLQKHHALAIWAIIFILDSLFLFYIVVLFLLQAINFTNGILHPFRNGSLELLMDGQGGGERAK